MIDPVKIIFNPKLEIRNHKPFTGFWEDLQDISL